MSWDLCLILGGLLIGLFLYTECLNKRGPYTGTTYSANPIPKWTYRYGA